MRRMGDGEEEKAVVAVKRRLVWMKRSSDRCIIDRWRGEMPLGGAMVRYVLLIFMNKNSCG